MKDPVRAVKRPDRIMSYVTQDKLLLADIIATGLLYNCTLSFGAVYQGNLIDALVGGFGLSSVLKSAALYMGIIIWIQSMRFLKRLFVRSFSNNMTASLRFIIYNRIMHRRLSDLERENTGDIMTRTISDVELCADGTRNFITEIFDTGVMLIAYLVAMFAFDVKITLLCCVFVPPSIFIAQKMKAPISRLLGDYRRRNSEMADFTYSSVGLEMMYRVNGMGDENRAQYEKGLQGLRTSAVKANIFENSLQPVYKIINLLGVLIVVYLGAKNIESGAWTIGMFTAYLAMFMQVTKRSSGAAKHLNNIQKAQVSWNRLKPYVGEYIKNDTKIKMPENHRQLTASGLCFNYGKGDSAAYIVKNVAIAADAGDMVGITGTVASGKSSLGLALTGMYDYTGSVLVGGRELRDMSEFERSSLISYMGHDPQLLSDTILSNITLGEEYDEQSVLDAIADVCMDVDMRDMPQGLMTVVGSGGVRLSGGQQARLALARTLWQGRPYIILDDPFSAVDMATESMIIENMKKRRADRVIIIISLRLAIFPRTDCVVFLREGNPIRGTHEHLMESCREYAELYTMQSCGKAAADEK